MKGGGEVEGRSGRKAEGKKRERGGREVERSC